MTGRPPNCRRTVLIAVDGSDTAKYSFKWSLENILKETDYVILAICNGEDSKSSWNEVDFSSASNSSSDVSKAERSRIENILSVYTSDLSKKLIASKSAVLAGSPKLALVGKAKEIQADLVVMGTRGLGAIKKAVLGSVSEYCVNNASCPVLVVRKPNY